MIPEFIRFYGYTRRQTLAEYAVAFFSMVNSMYRLKASETLDGIVQVGTGMAGDQGRSTIDDLKRQSKGIHGLLEEVKVIKGD